MEEKTAMLNLGNDVSRVSPVSPDDMSLASKALSIEKIEEEMKLFDELKVITRRSIHYTDFCADLANATNPGMIDFLTSILQGAIKGLSGESVSEKNIEYLQASIQGLASNFQEAAQSARMTIQRKNEALQAQQTYAAAAQAEQQAAQQVKPLETLEVQKKLDSAISETTDFVKFDNQPEQDGMINQGIDNEVVAEAKEIFNEVLEIEQPKTDTSKISDVSTPIPTPKITTPELPKVSKK